MDIRAMRDDEWGAVWRIIEPVFRAGETYVFSPDISKAEAHQAWVSTAEETFVAVGENGEPVGTYYLRPNQPGLGNHVANCGYIVSKQARACGVASALCKHSQQEAQRRGYRAIQFNFVAATNETAVRLWKKHGFAIAGTLPGAFRHSRLGYVDAYVMFKSLTDDAAASGQ